MNKNYYDSLDSSSKDGSASNDSESVSDDAAHEDFDEYCDEDYEIERFVKSPRYRKNLSKIPKRKDKSDW